ARHQISEEPILTDGLFAFLGFVFSSSFPVIFLFNSLFLLSCCVFDSGNAGFRLSFWPLRTGLALDLRMDSV
ncbi:hypothetical protein, partial [Plesiomonas shigelloides]|uniref:hypothetical protein n=1 Tax=Plesiomonas shigelloides TaxID=703 RepID=UPI001C499D6A